MQAPFDNIVQHLFHQPSLYSVTVDELENMATQHPYFAAAHFLLLKKMQDMDHPQFNTQLHKTTLYFNNPLWLQYLLQPETVADFNFSEVAPFIVEEQATASAPAEKNGNGHANENTVVSAYHLKEEEILLEKEHLPGNIDEAVVQPSNVLPQHSNGGIMDVITEVFEEEHNNHPHPSNFEEPATINETTDIHTPEVISDNDGFANNNEFVGDAPVEATEAINENTQMPEAFKPDEPVYTTDVPENKASSFQEELARHIAEITGKTNDGEDLHHVNQAEENHAAENAMVEEPPSDYHVPEDNNVVEQQAKPLHDQITTETYSAPAEEIPEFATTEANAISFYEEPAALVTEIATEKYSAHVEETHPILPEERNNADSFHEELRAPSEEILTEKHTPIIKEPQPVFLQEEATAVSFHDVQATPVEEMSNEQYNTAVQDPHSVSFLEGLAAYVAEISGKEYTPTVEEILPAVQHEEFNNSSSVEDVTPAVVETVEENNEDANFNSADIAVHNISDQENEAHVLAVEEAQPTLAAEEINNDSFNEDVTPSVIETIEENNAVVDIPTEHLANAEEIIKDEEISPVDLEEAATEDTPSTNTEEVAAQNADDTDKAEFLNEPGSEQEKPVFRTIIETPASKHDFLFEPYHTVDYFASQGIKLSKIEANSKDKLGRQLKSFTEWLKSMKKLPQASIDKILSENEESKVVADANHSIEKKEVITEAMAEVFQKQGMINEATGVYQKLSLLNPARSAYFAAKIEALKH